MKNSENRGVILPAVRQTVDVTTEGSSKHLIYKEIY